MRSGVRKGRKPLPSFLRPHGEDSISTSILCGGKVGQAPALHDHLIRTVLLQMHRFQAILHVKRISRRDVWIRTTPWCSIWCSSRILEEAFPSLRIRLQDSNQPFTTREVLR